MIVKSPIDHQEDGKGLIATDVPPLAGSEWVLEDEESNSWIINTSNYFN